MKGSFEGIFSSISLLFGEIFRSLSVLQGRLEPTFEKEQAFWVAEEGKNALVAVPTPRDLINEVVANGFRKAPGGRC